MNWNDRIRKVRKERRMRREDVVETMRAYLPDGETVSTRTLASWELGDSEPKISHAIALAKTYQIENVTELFFDDPARAGAPAKIPGIAAGIAALYPSETAPKTGTAAAAL